MNIITIPTGGLCNRMRAMASALSIAKQLHTSTTVYWNKYEGLNASYGQLFMPLEHTDSIKVADNHRWLYNVNYTKDYLLRLPAYKILFSQTVYNYNIYERHTDLTGQLHAKPGQKILLISGHPMCADYASQLSAIFKPQADIQARIDAVSSQFSCYTIGMHIRRTDNKASIALSPLQKFVDIIQREIALNSQTKIYLASDDAEVKAEMQRRFGDHIITLHDDASRNSLEGMKFAVVDLYCLSKTRRIIGSTASSYSQLAADLGQIEIEYAK